MDGIEDTAMIGARVGCFVDLFMVVDGALLIVRVGTFVLTGARDGCFVDTKISTEGV
jgi:hypothetical protein